MPFEFGKFVKDATNTANGSLIGYLVSNPIITAITITLIIMIIVLFLFRGVKYYKKRSKTSIFVKLGIVSFISTLFLIYLHNSYIKSLPDGLKVGGGLSVNNCKYIESLPDNLKVGGRLNLKNTKIKIFPLGLEVESDIYADNSEITIILSDIKVKGNVNLKNTPISKKYTEAQLKQMCPGIEGEIIYDQIN